MNKLQLALVMIVVALVSIAGSGYAQQKGIAGAWTLTAHGMSMHMVLSQDGAKISGSIDNPHGGGEIRLSGEFADGKLTLAGGSDGGDLALQLSFTGTLQRDGSLSGTLTTNVGQMPWTAVRVEGK